MIVDDRTMPMKPSRDIDHHREKMSTLYRLPKVQRAIKYLLPYLEKQGILE